MHTLATSPHNHRANLGSYYDVARPFGCSLYKRFPPGFSAIPSRDEQDRYSPQAFFPDPHPHGRLFILPEASGSFLRTLHTSVASGGLVEARWND